METLESMDSRVFEDTSSSSSDDDEDMYHESVTLKRDGTNTAGIHIFDEQTYVFTKLLPRSFSYTRSHSSYV